MPAEDRGYHRINRADLVTAAVEHGLRQALLAGYGSTGGAYRSMLRGNPNYLKRPTEGNTWSQPWTMTW
jgi:hypothetical protein